MPVRIVDVAGLVEEHVVLAVVPGVSVPEHTTVVAHPARPSSRGLILPMTLPLVKACTTLLTLPFPLLQGLPGHVVIGIDAPCSASLCHVRRSCVRCATIALMGVQDHTSFGEALKHALQEAGTTQAALARELHLDPSQVNRWIHDKAFPPLDTLQRIEKILGTTLSAALNAHKPKYELFVSAPVSGMAAQDIPEHHEAVSRVVAAARQHVNDLVWPGERVKTANDRHNIAPDIAAAHNFTHLVACSAFLYLQFAEVVGPSSALVELGFALGRKMKVTIIFKRGLASPYILRGFGGVAARLSFLPDTRIYEEESVDSATALIADNGRELLGLS